MPKKTKNHFQQINQLSQSAMKNRLISATFVCSILFAILLAHLPVTLSSSESIEDHLPIIGAGIKILLKDVDRQLKCPLFHIAVNNKCVMMG